MAQQRENENDQKTFACSLTVLATMAMPATAIAQEKFTFALNWFPVGDHAAYWVALDKGYFSAIAASR
ncbi:hypothetical protein [Devosia ginsengisoli]|uniref:hypothetical protein n=1 Tax=Devosia ginsengisoli TaxID=400770 RepID=UPI0026ED1ED2|nr:hypothetical protein [Devosia ginsengisoli]MCR6669805.1 hypothetical protein [Devosia ginsengisoli]